VSELARAVLACTERLVSSISRLPTVKVPF
jgi:hypothetical protein